MVNGGVARTSRISPRLMFGTRTESTFAAVSRVSPRLRVTTVPGQVAEPSFPPGFVGVSRRGRSAAVIKQQAEEAQAQARRTAQLTRSRQLLAKARDKLLTPQEKIELARITAPTIITRQQAQAQPGGFFSRTQLLEERKRREVESKRQQVFSEEQKLNIRQQALEGESKVLQRLADKGLLQQPQVTVFNQRIEQLRQDQQALLGRAKGVQKRIELEKEKEKTRAARAVPKTPLELLETGIPREAEKAEELKARGVQEKLFFLGGRPLKIVPGEEPTRFVSQIARFPRVPKKPKVKKKEVLLQEIVFPEVKKLPFGVARPEDIFFQRIPTRVTQTLEGIGGIGAGLAVGGVRFGAGLRTGAPPTPEQISAGLAEGAPLTAREQLLGRAGRAAAITAAAPIAVTEAVLSELFGQTVGLGEEVATRFFGAPAKPLKFEITEPTAKGLVTTVGGIPVVGALTGFAEAITPKGIFITRPVVSELATTVSILGAEAFRPRAVTKVTAAKAAATGQTRATKSFAAFFKKGTAKAKIVKPPTAFQKAVARQKIKVLLKKDVFALPTRAGIVPQISGKITTVQERFFGALAKKPSVLATKAQLARLRAERLFFEKFTIPAEAARVGRKVAFENAFLKALGITERAEFAIKGVARPTAAAIKRAAKPVGVRLTQFERQAKVFGLEGLAKAKVSKAALAQRVQLARLVGKTAVQKGVRRIDIFTGQVAKPITAPAKILRQRAQLAKIVGKTASQRLTGKVDIFADVFAKKVITKISKPIAKPIITTKARLAQRAQLAKLVGKTASQRLTKQADVFAEALAKRVTAPTKAITEPISAIKARAFQQAQLAKIIGKTAAKKVTARAIKVTAKPTAKIELAFQAPLKRLQFELGLRRFKRIPVIQPALKLPKKLLPKKVVIRKAADVFAPKKTKFFREFKTPEFTATQVKAGRGQVALQLEQQVSTFAPSSVTVSKQFAAPSPSTFLFGSLFRKRTLDKIREGGFITLSFAGRAATAERTRDFLSARSREFDLTRARIAEGIKSATKGTTSTIGKTFTGTTTTTGTTSATIGRDTQRTFERIITATRSASIPVEATKTITVTVPVPRVTTKPKVPPLIIPLPKVEEPKEISFSGSKVPAFVAFVKTRPFKKKKFKKVSEPLPEESAMRRGFFVADKTIAQTVRFKRSPKRVKRTFFPAPDLSFKFRQKGKDFIERRRFAIDTATEKQELSVAKFLKAEQRRAKSLFGF